MPQEPVYPENSYELEMVTPPGRLSYPHLIEPYAFKGKEPKFATDLVIPQDFLMAHPQFKIIWRAMIHYGKLAFAKPGYNPVIEMDGKLPKPKFEYFFLRDGDKEKNAEFQGCYILRARAFADNPPTLFGPDGKEITDKQQAVLQVYPGRNARLLISLKFVDAFENDRGEPVPDSCTMNLVGVQLLEGGASFVRRLSMEEKLEKSSAAFNMTDVGQLPPPQLPNEQAALPAPADAGQAAAAPTGGNATEPSDHNNGQEPKKDDDLPF